jgi:hypothetical protein
MDGRASSHAARHGHGGAGGFHRARVVVRADGPRHAPRDTQAQPPEHCGHPVPAERLGWMSSRFLAPAP